jgi:GntR family transcriptional regulator, transcriptional repressor for pyruvate dehydrogenase complex
MTSMPPGRLNQLAFQPIKRANVSDLAMDTLLDLIRRRVLKPGDRLPSQRQLVVQMGLSYTVVREALRGLASIGLIEVHPGRGAFVRSISPEMLIDPESLFFILQREALLQAIEVRRILEVESIALAAERATTEDLKELERVLKQIEQGVHEQEKPLRYAPHFHYAIAKATHNQVLSNMVKSFIRLLQRGADIIATRLPEAKELEYRAHAELYEPILRRDPDEARRRMLLHLEESKGLIVRGFAEIEESPE